MLSSLILKVTVTTHRQAGAPIILYLTHTHTHTHTQPISVSGNRSDKLRGPGLMSGDTSFTHQIIKSGCSCDFLPLFTSHPRIFIVDLHFCLVNTIQRMFICAINASIFHICILSVLPVFSNIKSLSLVPPTFTALPQAMVSNTHTI